MEKRRMKSGSKGDLLVSHQSGLSLFGLVSYLWELKNLGHGEMDT